MAISVWGARVWTDPEGVKREILAALTKEKGSRVEAAVRLKMPKRTLYNLIDRLEMWKEIEKRAKQEKWSEHGARLRTGKSK